MKLSILIPTFNRVEHLKKRLDYLRNEQIDSEYVEIIISDNGSTDGTNYLLKEYNFEGIKTFSHKENMGFQWNFKFLIDQAQGEFIWIIGDDDRLKKGIISSIVNELNSGKNLAHIFINYSVVENEKIIRERQYPKSKDLFYEKGSDMFWDIVYSSGYGSLMYISANVFKKDYVRECYELLETNNEVENMAPALGFALLSDYSGSGKIISQPSIYDEYKDVSWSADSIKVYCRDIIAILDMVAIKIGAEDEINKYLIENLPYKSPEFYYIYYGRRFKKDNYAMKWMRCNFPRKIIPDLVLFCTERLERLIFKIRRKK